MNKGESMIEKIYWQIRGALGCTNLRVSNCTQTVEDSPETKFKAFDAYFKRNQRAYQCGALGDGKNEFIKNLISQVENGALYHFDDRGLSWAAMNNVPELIEYFAKKGFDLEAYNNRAMRNAIHYEHYDAMKSLIANGVYVDDGIFKFTLANKYYDIAKFFVECGAHKTSRDYYRYFQQNQNQKHE